MVRNGVIVMTGLPLTRGHGYLLDFAVSFLKQYPKSQLYVILYSRSFEPVPGDARVKALQERYASENVSIFHVADDNVPQNPSEDPVDFWGNWRDRIRDVSPNKPGDFLFASEAYGVELAKVLGCEFVPCNVKREIITTSGTKVRSAPMEHFSEILPEMQKYFKKTVTLFGQESCGKSTMTKLLNTSLNSYMVPEWAREYLEMTSPDLDLHKMEMITQGQYASQKTVDALRDKPFVIRDTDLLSTIGYYKFWHGSLPDGIVEKFLETKSDLYIIMNDNIPFEVDPIRYGGDKRETSRQYWIDLLEEYKVNYYIVENTDMHAQSVEIWKQCVDLFRVYDSMGSFVRT